MTSNKDREEVVAKIVEYIEDYAVYKPGAQEDAFLRACRCLEEYEADIRRDEREDCRQNILSLKTAGTSFDSIIRNEAFEEVIENIFTGKGKQ